MIFSKKNHVLSHLMKLVMIISFFVTLYSRNYVVAVGIIGIIFISILPSIMSRRSDKTLPWSLDFMVTLALFLHTIGIVFDFYHHPEWWWWDELTHTLGTFVVGMFAFYLVFAVQFLGKVVMSVPMTGLFIFMASMGVGGVWEVFEFYSDEFLGTNMQLSLSETMRDMQMDVVGGILIALVGMRFLFIKREELDEFEMARELKEELGEQKVARLEGKIKKIKKTINSNHKKSK